MSNMSNLAQINKDWNDHLNEVMGLLKDMDDIHRELIAVIGDVIENEVVVEDEPGQPIEPQPTLEQVRTVLAKLAQDGRQAEVKALITKHGASRLSDVDPSHYSAMLKEAEGLQ